MKYVKNPATNLMVQIFKQQHTDKAGKSPEQGKRSVAFQFRQNYRNPFIHKYLLLHISNY